MSAAGGGALLFALLFSQISGCASPEERALRHLGAVVKLLEESCGADGQTTHCADVDKAAESVRRYIEENKKELGEIKRQLQETEQKLKGDPKKIFAWEEKYREPVRRLTDRIAGLMKRFPNLRSSAKVKEALRAFR